MRRLAAALSISLSLPAAAAIAPGLSGNGELFLNVFDDAAGVSYTLDLGVRMDAFFSSGQADAGVQTFWPLDGAVWSSFLALVDAAALRWSVLALDNAGSLAPGQQRLFTTVRQGDEAAAREMFNVALTQAISTSQGDRFFDTVNSVALAQSGQSTHAVDDARDYDRHGASYSLTTDPGLGYYGKPGGLTPTLNDNATFDAGNLVGQSSWFYYLTRSGSGAVDFVLVDEFDNLSHDGYWGFVRVADDDPTSPYAGRYLLSYTLAPAGLTLSQRQFLLRIGRAEVDGGWSVHWLGGADIGSGEAVAAWPMPDRATIDGSSGRVAAPVAVVPEPATWLLFACGQAALWALRRRRG
jgi:hypothetical protein